MAKDILEDRQERSIKDALWGDGWKTSGSKSEYYERPQSKPGVYVILVLRNDINNLSTYGSDEVLYVGQSTDLAKRMCGHEVFRIAKAILKDDLLWMWFKYSDKPQREEKRLISLYKPSLNTIHNG